MTTGLFSLGIVLVAAWLPAQEKLAPFVSTPDDVVERMLALASVQGGDVVYDLGCGDGRIPIAAAQKYAARAVCVELDDELFRKTSARVKELALEERIEMVHGDLLELDLSPATVITVYLLTEGNEKLRPNLERYLKRGARVVAHDFEIPGWKATKTEMMRSEHAVRGRIHRLYLYRVGEN